MPIVRTFACPECNYWLKVTLTMEQVDDPPPICPRCNAYDIRQTMDQEFKPFGITGSTSARAHAIAEEIITTDYHAADFQREHRQEGIPSVRYQDQTKDVAPAAWTKENANAAIAHAISIGRQTRQKYGSGLDVLQANLKSGAEPDLIAASKRRSLKVW